MIASTALAALCAGFAGWLAVRPVSARLRPHTSRGTVRFAPLAAALGVGAGLWVVVGGVPGLLLAPLAGVAAHRWTAARAPRSVRLAEERARADLPHLVALLVATLRAGADPVLGLDECARALPGPAADRLAPTIATARLGAPAAAWRDLAGDPLLGRLGRVLERTLSTGASVADAVEGLADDLAAEVHASAEDRAKRVGVRAAVPLGLCLLPAFMVLGILPVVASLLTDLLP